MDAAPASRTDDALQAQGGKCRWMPNLQAPSNPAKCGLQRPSTRPSTRMQRVLIVIMPRFADGSVEERYLSFTGEGLENVQRFFATASSVYATLLWAYHLTSPQGLDAKARTGLGLMHGAVGVAWLFWATLRYAASARRHSSALHALQSSLLAARQLWRVPSTLPEDTPHRAIGPPGAIKGSGRSYAPSRARAA